MEKTFVIIAGEASGDLHASRLVSELKKLHPGASFHGLGGKNMAAAGVRLWHDMSGLGVIGFFEILKNYATFKSIFTEALLTIKQLAPDAVILVDYPGFNLRLARQIKKLGIKIIYFISPQVWAWGKNRIKFIRSHVDLMLVLFKFEEIFYADGKFNVKFIGHPLLDIVRPTKTREQMLDLIHFKHHAQTIALLPGSREREVRSLLPIMLGAAQKIHTKNKNTQFLICRAATVPRQLIKDALDEMTINFPYKILDEATYDGLGASNFAIVASGTATLETAILNVPMIIIYKVSLLTYLLAKLLIKIPHIGLVNVVAGQKIVPELVQFNATSGKIARTTINFLEDKQALEKIHAELYAVKNTLGIPGAAKRGAEEIDRLLKNTVALGS